MTQAEKTLGNHAIKGFVDSTLDDKNEKAQKIFIAASLGFLMFSGAEAVRVIFRNDFGKKGVDMTRIYICFACFTILGLISFFNNEGLGRLQSCLLFLSAIWILYKGLYHIKSAIDDSDYQGTPCSDSFAQSSDISENRYVDEPLLMMGIGGFTFTLFVLIQIYLDENSSLNFPFLLPAAYCACAISVWVEPLLIKFFNESPTEKAEATVTATNEHLEPAEEFNEVIL